MVLFQSTPVIANGRIGACPQYGTALRCFNPRPLLLTGESPSHATHAPTARQFQSTPVIANGRIHAMQRTERIVVDVSIHARYC